MTLHIDHVSKSFPTQQGSLSAVEDIDVKVQDGEFVCFVGPSGCGKSTLLSIIAGLEQPTSGQVVSNGTPITTPGIDRVIMFQEDALFPWLNVLHNVEFGLEMNGVPRAQRRALARYYLKLVHLSRFERATVHELSGGMKQRVALARALVLNPKVLLMDEPFASLDAQTRELLHGEIQDIWSSTHKTVLFVTHNVREAVCLGDRVLVFTAQPGQIKREFHIDLPRPRNINSPDVTKFAQWIMESLREEIEKVVREEIDEEWTLQKGKLLRATPHTLGSGI